MQTHTHTHTHTHTYIHTCTSQTYLWHQIAHIYTRDLKGFDNGDKLIYIPNDNTQNYPFCWFQLVVETFGYSTQGTNQSKFNNSPQSCLANE